MSVEQNKENVRRLVEELYNKGNPSVLPELLAPSYVNHANPDAKGVEGITQSWAIYHKAFPDLHATVDNLVAEGDMVAGFFTMTGTFKGEMMGSAPNGKHFTQSGCVLSRHQGNKQVEAWTYWDLLSMLQQLGIPVPSG
jgi:predicted ester cyclase